MPIHESKDLQIGIDIRVLNSIQYLYRDKNVGTP